MKRIETADQRIASEEKTKKKVRWLGMFLLLIMIISSIGYAFMSVPDSSSEQDNTLAPKSGEFREVNGRWITSWSGQQLVFSSSPESVSNISVNTNLSSSDYYQQTVYYVQDGTLQSELQQSLGLYSTLQPVCLGKCEDNLPEKTCESLVISWNRTGDNRVYQNGNCVFIEGDLRAVDAFLYRVFGIS